MKKFLSLLLLFLTAFNIFLFIPSVSVKADSVQSTYSNVLDDLTKAENFDINDYPAISDNYSLDVIQIAESSDNDLLIYVYNPSAYSKKLIASQIRIGLPDDKQVVYKDYPLNLLSQSGVFFKYQVEGLTVKSDPIRYYEVVQIARPFEKGFDLDSSVDNETNNVVYKIADKYKFETNVNVITCEKTELETVFITNKLVGFIRYDESDIVYTSALDSHFIAFSTDKKIDELVEIDVFFTSIKRSYWIPHSTSEKRDLTLGESIESIVTIESDTVKETSFDRFFAINYEWNCIESVDDFKKSDDFKNSTVSSGLSLDSYEWVVRFFDTKFSKSKRYSSRGTVVGYNYSDTLIENVTILRLKFVTDGIEYNLGVVDNSQTGSDEPIIEVEQPDFWDRFIKSSKQILQMVLIIIFIIVFILVLVPCFFVLSPIFSIVIKSVIKVLKFLFNWFLKIITYPFRMLQKLFSKKE